MKILVLSDIHNQKITLEDILKKAKEMLGESFVCIIAGDITNFGSMEDLNDILNLISPYCGTIYFVLGNCDPLFSDEKFNSSAINLEQSSQEIQTITLVGFGGAYPKINHRLLKKLEKRNENVCLVTHSPPQGTQADLVSMQRHAGSKAVREAINTYKNIILSISGHIHESSTVSNTDGCLIVNPGPVTVGNFAIIEVLSNDYVQGKIYNIHEM